MVDCALAPRPVSCNVELAAAAAACTDSRISKMSESAPAIGCCCNRPSAVSPSGRGNACGIRKSMGEAAGSEKISLHNSSSDKELVVGTVVVVAGTGAVTVCAGSCEAMSEATAGAGVRRGALGGTEDGPEKGEDGREPGPELEPADDGGAVFNLGGSGRSRMHGAEVSSVSGERNCGPPALSCGWLVSRMFAVDGVAAGVFAVTMLLAVHWICIGALAVEGPLEGATKVEVAA